MKRTLCMSVIVVCALVCGALGQNATLAVDGSLNPNGIGKDDAFAMIFRLMASPLTSTNMANKIARIGFTDPQDVAQFTNSMQAFRVQSVGTPQQPADQIALSQQYQSQLGLQLTPEGYNQLSAFVQSRKKRMAQWTSPSSCGTDHYTTYYDTMSQNYGSSTSDWDMYGDGIGYSSCTCEVLGSAIMVTYKSVNTYGTVSGSTETVSKVVPNGATTNYADSGTIYETTYSFTFLDTCSGGIHISYSVDSEFAYTKFANVGLGGGCTVVAGGEVCTWYVSPICSNTTSPDYKNPSLTVPPWIRDYDFAAWKSVAVCERVVWTGGHSTWMCAPIWPANLGTSDVSSGVCTYNP